MGATISHPCLNTTVNERQNSHDGQRQKNGAIINGHCSWGEIDGCETGFNKQTQTSMQIYSITCLTLGFTDPVITLTELFLFLGGQLLVGVYVENQRGEIFVIIIRRVIEVGQVLSNCGFKLAEAELHRDLNRLKKKRHQSYLEQFGEVVVVEFLGDFEQLTILVCKGGGVIEASLVVPLRIFLVALIESKDFFHVDATDGQDERLIELPSNIQNCLERRLISWF